MPPNQDNDSVSLTSLNLTITMSFFGMMWAVASYILFTKWKCLDNETLWTHQLYPYIKPTWDKISPVLKDYLYGVCCSCCYKMKQQEQTTLIKEQRNGIRGDYSSTRTDAESGSTSDRLSIDGNRSENGSVHNAEGYTTLSGHNSEGEEQAGRDRDMENVDITYRGNTEQLNTANGDTDCERASDDGNEETEEPEPQPLISNRSVILIFSLTQILARPFIIAVNIAYLVIFGKYSFNFIEAGAANLWSTMYGILYQETVSLVVGPISNAIYWSCCWRQCRGNQYAQNCQRFLEFMRFSDLVFVIISAPFSNTHFYVLGGWWYLALVVRLFFYGVTFAAGVVAGIRFVCACFCKIFFTCGCDNDVLEIRNLNHLLVEVGLKIIPIFLRINASSSALGTYLNLVGIHSYGGFHFRLAYFSISLIRSITALFSLGFTGAMLRWAVLKREHKLSDQRWLTTTLRFLDRYQPHVHISFFFDMFTYFSLIVLNLILLELVSDA